MKNIIKNMSESAKESKDQNFKVFYAEIVAQYSQMRIQLSTMAYEDMTQPERAIWRILTDNEDNKNLVECEECHEIKKCDAVIWYPNSDEAQTLNTCKDCQESYKQYIKKD